MKGQENFTMDYYTVDVTRILKKLLKNVWIIVLCGILTASIGFSISAFAIEPSYSSHIKLYIDSSSANPSIGISSSELNAAQSLVKTYGEILDSRTTLERVIEKSGVSYSWKELRDMITHYSCNNTEIMGVTVTGKDPYEVSKIANTIAEVLPVRITEIIKGSSMNVVDQAVPEFERVSPNVFNYTLIGLILGSAVSVAVISLRELTSETTEKKKEI